MFSPYICPYSSHYSLGVSLTYSQWEEETPKKLNRVKQILPSLEVSGFPRGNRKSVVVVESKQWGSCKTVRAWTVGQQDALSGYNCTLQGSTPAKLEIRVFPSLPCDSSTRSRLCDLLPETKCSAVAMEAAAMLLLM